MNVVIIQPPLVQLNTAYPSGAYLCSFFRHLGYSATWYDMSIKLFSSIFCKKGLETLFNASMDNALRIARKAQAQGDEATSSNIYRYISQRYAWINWIDTITAILSDGGKAGGRASGREMCHRFISSPHTPTGLRMENYIASLDREPTIDDARFLASLALADLADYITAVFDSQFALVRYGESLAVSETSFDDIAKGINSPVLKTFYRPLLEKTLKDITIPNEGEKLLACISIPFAGTFTAGLVTAEFFKETFKDNVFVVMGGGFINTELRNTEEKGLSSFIDAISYDRGYGSYLALIKSGLLKKGTFVTPEQKNLYKTRLFSRSVIIPPAPEDCEESTALKKAEDTATCRTVPDYSDIDFSEYPRMADDTNPMQRLWSDGAWLKAYLAHGCYWHRCAFCDVTLDYVSAYKLTDIPFLYQNLKDQAKKHGVYGIHFVDEAMPPKAMIQFSALNAQDEYRLSFWGNIRFEKVFSRDMADFLSYGGLTGVSGGIEIATGSGLDTIHKGTDIDSIVSACCAFKEAGILIHAYMIYGYWNESETDLINSMETLRQLYQAGLLDSSFWHKFTLTRHSRIYAEWQEGKHPDLKPVKPKNAGIFASNALHFEGEQKSSKFGNGLNAALYAWMHGESLEMPVGKWFHFKTPFPTVSPNLVEKAIGRYEKRRDREFSSPIQIENCWWLAGTPVIAGEGIITWIYMREIMEERTGNHLKSLLPALCDYLSFLRPECNNRQKAVQELTALQAKHDDLTSLLKTLRGRGLCQL